MTSSTSSTYAASSARSLASGTRSLGLKLIAILFLVILMAIPIMFISFVSFERSDRANDVTRDVGAAYGGQQVIGGPMIVIPYTIDRADGSVLAGEYIVSPETGRAVFDPVTVDVKKRSLFRVPVYTIDGSLSASFGSLDDLLPKDEGYEFALDRAKIVVQLAGVTGLLDDPVLQAGSRRVVLEPFGAGRAVATPAPRMAAEDFSKFRISYDRLDRNSSVFLAAPMADLLGEDGAGEVTLSLRGTGAKSLSIYPYARSTTVKIASPWPHPGFEGQFPPGEREISDSGFSADWSVPYLRRGVPASGTASDIMPAMSGKAMRVNFVTPLNPYRTVNRALKYAVMFIGLVFLAYFLMETLLGVRVHPAQYLLIGLAQAVFYLLLLAFSEQIGFTPAFALSALATIAVTAGYAGAVFGRHLIWKAAAVFAAVYGLLFVLMRIQDFALMIGALVSFVAIAATLYLTRNLDWYGGRGEGA